MKLTFTLVIITLCAFRHSLVAQIPSYVPSNGLVGWWPFNGNANDESGNGNNGTVNGATLTTDRFGNSNNAYFFSHLNEIVTNFNSISGTQARTFSFWMKNQHSTKTISPIWYGGSPTTPLIGSSFNIIFNRNEQSDPCGCWPTTFQGIGLSADWIYTLKSTVVGDNNWHHWVVVLTNNGDSFNQITYYKDGVLINTAIIFNYNNNGSTIVNTNNQNKLKFGKSQGNGINPDKAPTEYLDDIGVWNRALTQSEITSLFSTTYTTTPPPTIAISTTNATICAGTSTLLTASSNAGSTPCTSSQLPSSLQTGLIGYWPFCGNANDASGNGNNGTVNGATLTTDRFGNASSAYSFDGVDDFISTNLVPVIGSNNRSVSFFLKAESIPTSTDYACISWGGNTPSCSQAGLDFECNIFNFGGINARIDGTCTAKYSTNSFDLNWHMITYVVNNNLGNSFSSIQIYIDGVLANTASYNGSTTVNTTNLATLIFGNSNKLNRYLHGKLDDIVIWNRALTTAEIQQLYILGQATYSWSNGVITTSITVSPTTTTTYTCTVTSNGVSSSASSTISVIPTSSITTTSSSICEGQNTTLTATTPTLINSCPTLSGTLTNGLVGYWPFCGNANDASGNGNNGSVNGATLTTDRFGNSNSAYSFDGVSNQIIATVNNLPQSNSARSMSFWAKYNAPNTQQVQQQMVGYGPITNNQRFAALYWPNYFNHISVVGQGNDFSETAYQMDNNWHLFVVTHDANTAYLYIDGILMEQSLKTYATSGSQLFIGNNGNVNHVFGEHYNGKIDDVGIWNRALTASEIQQLYTMGQTTYSWSPGGASTPSITVTPASTTTYTYTATSNGLACPASQTITVNSLPSATVIQNGSTTFCPGSSVQLCAPTGTGLTYSWSGNLGTTSCITVASTQTTAVTVTNAAGCFATSAPQSIVVLGNPVANAGLDGTITCVQNATGYQIGSTPNPTYTYSWTPTTGLSNPNIANPIANPSATTTYTLNIVNADGCTGSDQVVVTVNKTIPLANAGLDFTKTCVTNVSGTSVGMTAVSGNTYSWTPTTGLSSSAVANPTANPSATTTYTLTTTNTANGCSANDQVVVTVNTAIPSVDAGLDFTKTCVTNVSGASVGMTSVSGNTYSWTPTTGLSSSTAANPTANPSATTTYNLSTTNTANGCTANDQVVVTVNTAIPSVDAGLDFTKTCVSNASGAAVGMTAVNGNTYTWTPTTGLSSSTASNNTANPSVTTTYTLTTTNTANGCTANDQVVVIVNTAIPSVDAGLDFTKTCVSNASGAAVGMTAVSGNTYSWTPSIGLSSSTASNATANPSVTTTYTLTATNTINGCIANDQVVVTVNTTPPTINAGIDQSICLGQSVTFNASTNAPILNWNNSVQNNIPFVPNSVGSFTYIASATGSNGCTANDDAILTVNTLPIAQAGLDGLITCSSNPNGASLGSNPIAGETYSWTPTSGLSNAIIANPIANPVSNTIYTVTTTNSFGCSAIDSVFISVDNNAPILDAGNDQNICNGDSLLLFATEVSGSTITWNGNVANGSYVLPTTSSYYFATALASNGCNSIDSILITVLEPTTSTIIETACDEFVLNGNTYNQSGTYTQVITNSTGCDSTITLNLNIIQSPTTPVVYVQNEVNLSTDVVPGLTYQWMFCTDLTPVQGAINSSFNPTANAYYAVIVSNSCGSDTSECAEVSTIGLFDFIQRGLKVYPNPNNGHFTIEIPSDLSGQDLHILDINGRTIRLLKLHELSNSIDMEELNRGTYWLQIGRQKPIQIVKN